ncbi:hypothetical protein DL93DRAFT_2095395 [Clavulina sp. PMI_390]|nr:hypothetical protein DL93DRAFT_2095395 [Clavulina sp. PMI_390]
MASTLPLADSFNDPAFNFDESDEDVDSLGGASVPPPRRFLDPIHDYVELEPRVTPFVDTRQFQRLRYLKQLGVAYLVFPGGAHNSSALAILVSHTSLGRWQPELKITDRDVFCVQLAGLMHDLGHGPFSHVFDNEFIARVRPDRKWCHEEGSEMMFDALIKENPHIPISQDEINFVKDLIRGRPRLTSGEKPFLFQIVANAENGLDVDKLDYLDRDAYQCGIRNRVTTSRIMDNCRVVNGKTTIAFPYKDHFNIYMVYHSRYALHKQVYNHKTGKAIEYMVVDALIEADRVLKFSEMIDNPDDYVNLTDDILLQIERSKDPELEKARKILERLRKRRLYRVVDFKVVPSAYRDAWENRLTADSIVEEAMAVAPSEAKSVGLNKDDIIVDFSALHMGMKDRNPMDCVMFYSKHAPNKASFIRQDEGFNILPEFFQEVQIKIFTREESKKLIIQKAYRSLISKLPDVNIPSITNDDEIEHTPSFSASSLPPSFNPNSSFESSTSAGQSDASLAVPSTPPNRPRSLGVSPQASVTGSGPGFPSGFSAAGSPTGSVTSTSHYIPGQGRTFSRHGSRSFSAKEQNQFMTLPESPGTVKKNKNKRARGEESDGDMSMDGTDGRSLSRTRQRIE